MRDIFDIQDKKIKDNKLSGFSNRKQDGDYWNKSDGELMISPIEKSRIYILAIIIGLAILIVLIYLVWLQGVLGKNYRNTAEGNRIRLISVKADRGLIYDRNFRPLVKNIPNFSLAIIPGDLPKDKEEKQKVLNKLNTFLNKGEMSDDFIKNLSLYSYQPVTIIEQMDYTRTMKLMLELDKLPGVILQTSALRQYIYADNLNLFSHILGYVGKISQEELEKNKDYLLTDLVGKTGLELYYEDVLKGINGQKRIEVNSFGKEERVESYKSPKTGQNLILTIDLDLQKKIAEVLNKYIKLNNSKAGAVIALNPQNGEVLSIFSWPNYNNNIFIVGTQTEYQKLVDNVDKPFFFRAIAGEYPLGSVIKPVIAAGALQDGIINSKTTIFSQGGIQVKQWLFKDWKNGGHGSTDIIKALAESVNTFFYYIGGGFKDFKGLGIERINHYAKLFGLTKKTGIDLPGERSGLLADPEWKSEIKNERWYIGDTYHISIGQGDILVTPIQVANYMAAIANNGILFRPYVVKSIRDPETGKDKITSPEIINENFIDPEHIELIRLGLRSAVTKGSAIRLASLPFEIAGKTGTAQVGGEKNSHAWFTGFAPYENPEFALTILIENGGEGSVAAVPAAKEIFDWWWKNR